jgi:hypothetical protein
VLNLKTNISVREFVTLRFQAFICSTPVPGMFQVPQLNDALIGDCQTRRASNFVDRVVVF